MAIEHSYRPEMLDHPVLWPFIYQIGNGEKPPRYGVHFHPSLTGALVKLEISEVQSEETSHPAIVQALPGVIGDPKGYIRYLTQYQLQVPGIMMTSDVSPQIQHPAQFGLFWTEKIIGGLEIVHYPFSTPGVIINTGRKRLGFESMARKIVQANPVGSRENWLPNQPNSRE